MAKQYLCTLFGVVFLAACPVTDKEEKAAQNKPNASDDQVTVRDGEKDEADEDDSQIVDEKDEPADLPAPTPVEKPVMQHDASVEEPVSEDAGMPEEEPEIPVVPEEDAGVIEEVEEDAGAPVVDAGPAEEPECKPIPITWPLTVNDSYNWSLGGWPHANLTFGEMAEGVCYDTGGCTTKVGLVMANLSVKNRYYDNLRGQVHGCREFLDLLTDEEEKDLHLDFFECMNRGYSYRGANFVHNGYTWLASRWAEPVEPGATRECVDCMTAYVDCTDPCFETVCSAVNLDNATPACLECMERCAVPARECTKLNFSKL